jgi:hypothetical protein
MSGETAAAYALPPFRSVRMNVRAGRWSVAWVVIAVLIAICAAAINDPVDRVQFLRDWHLPTRVAQMEIAEHRALHGEGPDEADLEPLRRAVDTASGRSARVRDRKFLQIDRGSFNLSSSDDPGASHFTWRLARADGDATVFWICGYASAPGAASVADVSNLTNVPPQWLPSVCRTAP